MLRFYEQVFRPVFRREVAFGFDYYAVGKDEVWGVVVVGGGVADSAGFVARLYSGLFELFLYGLFKAGTVRARFVAEDRRGSGVRY